MARMSSKAAGLKAAIDESVNQLAQAVDEQTASEEFRKHLDFQARFHRYSWGNCWLIAMAKPDATLVAGFSQWKRLGRAVKKGEKAIRIMAPCPVWRENPKTGDEEERLFFNTACVWDVSQTEGKELPQFEVPDVQRSAGKLLETLQAAAAKRGVRVQFVNMADGHYGNSKGGEVQIATGYSTGQQAKTLAHELAHLALHWSGDGRIDPATSREIRELEAEAVAYVVCRHFGLDVELRSSRYIAMWGGDAKTLSGSMARISGAARELIEDVERQARAAVQPGSPARLPAPSEDTPILSPGTAGLAA